MTEAASYRLTSVVDGPAVQHAGITERIGIDDAQCPRSSRVTREPCHWPAREGDLTRSRERVDREGLDGLTVVVAERAAEDRREDVVAGEVELDRARIAAARDR